MSGTDWLAHVQVLDAGTTPAARYCGWLFVQNGATVVDAGTHGPQVPPEAVAFLDTGKTSSPVDGAYDVVLIDAGSADVADVAAGALTGRVDTFGPDGPRAHWQADELVLAALGGAAGYTRGRDGAPVYGFGLRYQYLAGLYLYLGLTAALSDPASPTGREISVSELETVASLLPYATTQYAYNGSESILEQSGPRFVVGCTDGWLVVYAGLAWPALVGMLGRDDLANDERFVALDVRFRHVQELGEVFEAWGVGLTVAEALAAATAHDVAATAVRSPAEVLADEELAARGTWHDVDGGGLAPSLPYLVISEGVPDVA
ncbi:CoA transferase [Aeromicrobium sp.]|uniref:CoA transferase n=1 Tax=Aeromicrobium sp. TaxID=1871063 RepID=UPI00403442D4